MSAPIVRRRKKAVEVDSIQWLGDNETDVQDFTGGAAYFYALDSEDRENSDDPEATATVYDRLHSTWVLVYTGQHIVRGVKGEFYPIAEEVLAETYEDAGTPLHADCRTQFLNEAADVADSCVALYEGSDEAAPAAGAMEGLADRFRRMAGEKVTAPAAAATPDAEAYDGELAMARGLIRVLRTVARQDDLREMQRLLIEHTADETAAYAERGKGGPRG